MADEKELQEQETDTTQNAETGGEADGSQADNQQEEPDSKPIQMTQKQLDDLINKAFAKGARKGKREASSEKPPASDEAAEDTGEKDAAQALLQKANERLLSGTIKELAADLGITAKGAKAALKLGDFSHCFKDDDVDEESVKDILEDFLKEYPEFAATQKTEEDGSKPWGLRHGAGQKMSGVEAAFFARNPGLKK